MIINVFSHIYDHIERRLLDVLHGIDDDTGRALNLGYFARVVVPRPDHIYMVLLHEVEECIDLFEGVVGGMPLRRVALEEGGVGAYDTMAERLIVSPLQCLAQPCELLGTHSAFGGVEDDIEVLLARGRAHDKVIGARLEELAVEVPLVEIDVVVADDGHEGVGFGGVVRHIGEGRRHEIVVVLRVDEVAEKERDRALEVGVVVGDEGLPVAARGVDVNVGAHIDAVVLVEGVDNGDTVFGVVGLRFLEPQVDTRGRTRHHTDDVVVARVRIAGSKREECQEWQCTIYILHNQLLVMV